MKITKTDLRNIIIEEINRLDEEKYDRLFWVNMGSDWKFMRNMKYPFDIKVNYKGHTVAIGDWYQFDSFGDTDPVYRITDKPGQPKKWNDRKLWSAKEVINYVKGLPKTQKLVKKIDQTYD
jgi:hypothetical protein